MNGKPPSALVIMDSTLLYDFILRPTGGLEVLIDRGCPILHDDSMITNLNISRWCQENVDGKNLDPLFSFTAKKAA